MDIAAQRGYQGEAAGPQRTTAKVIAGGSLIEGIAGLATVALAIIGLAGVYPNFMAYVATIVFGAALIFEGGAISSRARSLMEESTAGPVDMSSVGGGMTAEFLAGVAGVALGVLAILGVLPVTLTAVAVIVFGGALVMGSSTTSELNYIAAGKYPNETARLAAREAVGTAANLQLLFGIGTIIMGILALVDQPQMIYALIGLLAAGTAGLFTGSALTGRMSGIIRR